VHILLIHQAFAALDEPGGTRHHELARHLVAEGHRVTVVTSPVSYLTGTSRESVSHSTDPRKADDGVTILRVTTYAALHRSFAHRLVSFFSFMFSSLITGLRVREVDLVWGTSPPIFQGLTAWLLARLKGVPFLFEVRDLWPAFAVAVGVLRQPVLIQASEWLERFLYRRADCLVVNSPGFIAHVQARGGTQVVLVPNGSDTAMFDPTLDGADFRREHGLGEKFIAMYAGAHGMSNDLTVLLEAAERLHDRREIAVVLVGDGKEKPSLQARAEQMGLENVHFIPPLPKTEMPHALAAADACIAILKPIELYKTVYPNKVFDYMAAGRPVVLAIDGVIRQVVEEAEAGLAVPPGDPQALAEAVCRLAENPQLGREMGSRGRATIEAQFDRVSLAEKMAEILEDLARHH
jgi:glycosyltransferase involved in cell wall biosynthesis